ncbi:hypothetical protein RCL1_004555 [Eukaryota sp. TZLM3-RCL]
MADDTVIFYADLAALLIFLFTGSFFYSKASSSSKSALIYDLDSQHTNTKIAHKTALLNGLSAIIAFISATCLLLGLSNLVSVDNGINSVNLVRYIDWMITCPLLQVQLAIVADSSTLQVTSMVFHVFFTNFGGMLGAFSVSFLWKTVFFIFSCFHFSAMVFNLNNLIKQSSQGSQSLWMGTSSLRRLCLLTILTWIPFPILWIVSVDGFDLFKIGIYSEVLFNLIGLIAKLSVQITIALRKLETLVIAEVSTPQKIVSPDLLSEGEFSCS